MTEVGNFAQKTTIKTLRNISKYKTTALLWNSQTFCHFSFVVCNKVVLLNHFWEKAIFNYKHWHWWKMSFECWSFFCMSENFLTCVIGMLQMWIKFHNHLYSLLLESLYNFLNFSGIVMLSLSWEKRTSKLQRFLVHRQTTKWMLYNVWFVVLVGKILGMWNL